MLGNEPDDDNPTQQLDRRRSSLRYRSLSENDLIGSCNNTVVLGSVLQSNLLDGTEDDDNDGLPSMIPPESIVFENDRTMGNAETMVDVGQQHDYDSDGDGNGELQGLPPPPPPPPPPPAENKFHLGTPVSISKLRRRNEEKLRQSLMRLEQYDDANINRTQKLREFLQQSWVREFVGRNSDERQRIALRKFRSGGEMDLRGPNLTALKRHHTDDFYVNFQDNPDYHSLTRTRTGAQLRKKWTIQDWVSRDSEDENKTSDDKEDLDEARPMERLQVSVHREHLIESLAWFSFHTPRCVLEDLTNCEFNP